MIHFSQLHTMVDLPSFTYHYHMISDPLLDQVQYVSAPVRGFSFHTLYLTDAENFSQYCAESSCSWIVIDSSGESAFDPRGQNVLRIVSTREPEDIFEDVVTSLYKENYCEDARLKLQEAALSGNGLDYLAETASCLLHNPLMITDRNFKIIATSKDHGERHDYWRRSLEAGYCSYENFIQNKDILSRALSSRKPVLDTASCPDGAILMGSIGTSSDFLGYIAVFECTHKIGSIESRIFEYLQQILLYQIQLLTVHSSPKWQDQEITLLLQDMLQQGSGDTSLVLTFFEKLRLPLSRYYYVLKIGEAPGHPVNIPGIFVISQLEHIMSTSRCVLTRSHLLVFLSRERFSVFKDTDEKQAFISFLSDHQLCAGISSGYDDLTQIMYALHQADTALEHCLKFSSDNGYSLFSDTISHRLIKESSAHLDLLEMCDPRLIRAVRYDCENLTEYFATFYELIHAQCDTRCVMKKLHVHRNTLYYRMQKMEALFDLVWKDIPDYGNLLLSSDILFFLGNGSLDASVIMNKIRMLCASGAC